jgi:hypothetical protein
MLTKKDVAGYRVSIGQPLLDRSYQLVALTSDSEFDHLVSGPVTVTSRPDRGDDGALAAWRR